MSLLLLQELLEKGIYTAVTIGANLPVENCPSLCDFLVTDDNKIVVVRWYDNKVVNMAHISLVLNQKMKCAGGN